MKITSIENASTFWTVLSLSKGKGNLQGPINAGEMCKNGLQTQVTDELNIPARGDTHRLFLLTSAGGYRIFCEDDNIYFSTAEGSGDPQYAPWEYCELKVDEEGMPSVHQVVP